MLERTDIAENPVLRVLADSAGVVKNQVSLARFLGEAVAHFKKHTFDSLTVGHVPLTTIGVHERHRFTAAAARRHKLANTCDISLLPVKLSLLNKHLVIILL